MVVKHDLLADSDDGLPFAPIMFNFWGPFRELISTQNEKLNYTSRIMSHIPNRYAAFTNHFW